MTRYKAGGLFSFFILLMALLVAASPALAGNGTFAGNGFGGGTFNFCVSVRFNAIEAQLEQIRTGFRNGSNVLLDATDNQHRFSLITLVNNRGASQTAEYWVNPGAATAYATYGQYGVRGQFVNLFFNSNFQATNGAAGDAYTVAHEHVHHAYGVADEYSGPCPCFCFPWIFCTCSCNADDAPFPDTATLNYSLMDNYFTRGGNFFNFPNAYTLNEFCVAGNHDPDWDTWQQAINGESVWETVAWSRYPALPPVLLPVDAPPPAVPVNFVNGSGGLRVVLLIDRSNSTGLNQRLNLARQGANRFIDLLATGDRVGAVSFATAPATNFTYPLSAVTDTVRAELRDLINNLSADGETNIGWGLQEGLGVLSSQSDRACKNEVIVLLSDGDQNAGISPSDVIPVLREEGVMVLTVGVGTGISASGEALLQDIARETNGRYYRVAGARDVTRLFIELSTQTSGGGLLARAPQAIGGGGTLEYPVLVEPGVETATFALAKELASDEISLSLRTPSGGTITVADPSVRVITDSNSTIIEVPAPEAGTWRMLASAGAVTSGQIDLVASASHDGVQLNLWVENALVAPTEAATIMATPLFEGERVVGASVHGVVRRPDESEVPITLLDNGVAPDMESGDGIYAAEFSSYNGDGTYEFDLTATATGASTYSGEALFISAGHPTSAHSVHDFVRIASATAVVTSIPIITATARAGGSISPSGSITVSYDASRSFTITPSAGFHVLDVLVDGASVGAATSYTFAHVTAGHTISASFAPTPVYTITASAGANGSISPSGDVSVESGADQQFTFIPDPGYGVWRRTVDGVEGISSAYTFSNVDADHTISVTFGPRITASAGANGHITPTGTSTIAPGGSKTYGITPDTGYSIADVLVDGVSVGAVTYYTFRDVTTPHTISVIFEETPYYLIDVSAGDNGKITPYGVAGGIAVMGGTNKTFTITPNANYQVADVLVDGNPVGAVTSYTFSNVTADHTISATFELLPYRITASAGANGTITPSGTVYMAEGGSQKFTFTPNAGYGVWRRTVDGVEGSSSSYTFNNVQADHTISVTFGPRITASAGANGKITPFGTSTVAPGGSKTYGITPNTGYHVANVLVDGSSVGAVTSYKFTNVTTPRTISVTFAPNP